MQIKTYVLYHAGCADGFASAFAAWLYLADSAEYLPVSYGRPVPELEPQSAVYIVDFSYPASVLRELQARMRRVIVIDHHATAKAELEAVAGEITKAIYVPHHSGCVLTWLHFHDLYRTLAAPPAIPEYVPQLLQFVEDRDLWRWHLPYSRQVNAALDTYPREFETWKVLAGDLLRLKHEGQTALRMLQEEARRVAAGAWVGELAGYDVPIVNATSYYAEVGEAMLELHPEARFVAMFRDKLKQQQRIWSLRSRSDFDCSAIARQFGGGGHAQACGFEEEIYVNPAPLIQNQP